MLLDRTTMICWMFLLTSYIQTDTSSGSSAPSGRYLHIILYHEFISEHSNVHLQNISLIQSFDSQMPLMWDTVFTDPKDPGETQLRKGSSTRETLKEELVIHEAGCGRGYLLGLCWQSLSAISSASVQPECNSSIVRNLLGENRVKLNHETVRYIGTF